MVTLVEPTNVQKIEFNVTTTEGPSCVTIITGTLPISLAAALGRSIQLLLVFVSTVEPNHDPPQGTHCGPHRHASYHKPQHAEEKIANAGRRDVFFIRVPEIAHVESDQYQAER